MYLKELSLQKLVQLFNLFLVSFFVVSCSDTTNLIESKNPATTITYTDPIRYLNSIRSGSNLNTLKINPILNASSLNHAKYTVVNNSEAHFQTQGASNFTGVSPTDRGFFVGYNSPVSENIAINANDEISSITNLMSAIYHRFGFLDTTIDEIGWGEWSDDKNRNFVYNMGNSRLERFCKSGISDGGYGKFYGDFCKDKALRISEAKFDSYKNLNYTKFVYYPNSQYSKPFFSKEIPDPMPECKITANPVSIDFTNSKAKINMKSFKIFKNGVELKNSKILTSSNDPNRRFNEYQFANFILSPFKFDTEYEAKFSYKDGNEDKEISWKFKTITPDAPYFVVKGGERLALKPDIWYEIFFYPNDCNDIFNRYEMSYRFMKKPEILSPDTNTIRVKLSGIKGSKLTLKTDSNKKIDLILTQTSPTASAFDFKFIILGVVIAFLAIIILLKSRR